MANNSHANTPKEMGLRTLAYRILKVVPRMGIHCIVILLFLFAFTSKGWCESSGDTNEAIADYKICGPGKDIALKKIKNPKEYFLKYEAWKTPDKVIWNNICQGKDTNLVPNPTKKCEKRNRQIVNPRFLKTILLDPNLKKMISHKGVRIKCARFEEKLDLSKASIGFPLEISESTFEKQVDLSWLKSDSSLTFNYSTFKEGIDFNNIKTASDLDLSDSYILEPQDPKTTKNENDIGGLFGAKIGDQLILVKTYFRGYLDMRKIQVADCIIAVKLRFMKMVDMSDAKVGGCIRLDSANRIEEEKATWQGGELTMTNIEVGQILDMHGGLFNSVNLVNAEIGNDFKLNDSKINGSLEMEKIHVAGDLLARDIMFNTGSEIDLKNSIINKNLDISGSKNLPSVNLTSGSISGDLILKSDGKHPEWRNDARLVLRDLEITNLIESEKSWPPSFDLIGFRYKRLYNSSEGEPSDFHDRDELWIKNWLKGCLKKSNDEQSSEEQNCKQHGFSLQPYFQMASVLDEAGDKEIANSIRYFGKQAEHQRAQGVRYWWLLFQAIFIGYGYNNWQVAGFFAVLLGIGIILCKRSGLPSQGNVNSFEFSLDLLLPIIELNKEKHGLALQKLPGLYRGYFYFHKIMGYVLASYLIAGLTGLGK